MTITSDRQPAPCFNLAPPRGAAGARRRGSIFVGLVSLGWMSYISNTLSRRLSSFTGAPKPAVCDSREFWPKRRRRAKPCSNSALSSAMPQPRLSHQSCWPGCGDTWTLGRKPRVPNGQRNRRFGMLASQGPVNMFGQFGTLDVGNNARPVEPPSGWPPTFCSLPPPAPPRGYIYGVNP